MAKGTLKETIKKQTIKDMKSLGIYKSEYNRVINIYAELVSQYSKISQKFEDDEHPFEVSTADGGSKKSPVVLTLETLRKDILAYSDRLCLNPKALESITIENKKKSKLDDVLKRMK